MIKFYNIKTKETRVAETEPMIAAFWASGDRGPNASFGQDFGWRLAPETVIEMRKIQNSPSKVRDLAQDIDKLPETVTETDILKYISDQNSDKTGMANSEEDFTREYEDEIRKLEAVEQAEVKSTKESNKEKSDGKETSQKASK